ncbi:MAG: ABC transporter permease [Fimbriimonas sp.]
MLSLFTLTLALSTPLIFAALGGYTSERAGVINIGLEGMMLAAACAAAVLGYQFGPVAGLAGAVVAGTAMSLLHWLATQVYRIDHVISAMAINCLAAGGTNFVFQKFAEKHTGGKAPALPIEFYYGIALLLPFLVALYVRHTRGGLRLLAVGSDPDKARLMGVAPVRVRLFGLLATGILTGLGGAMLVTYTGVFTDNMTAGRGYIALAALILGGWRPVPALAACIAFGFFSALRLQLEGTAPLGIELPSEAWASLPYIVTVIALAGFLGKPRTPAGLGKP